MSHVMYDCSYILLLHKGSLMPQKPQESRKDQTCYVIWLPTALHKQLEPLMRRASSRADWARKLFEREIERVGAKRTKK